jgi:hypothetical protein
LKPTVLDGSLRAAQGEESKGCTSPKVLKFRGERVAGFK